MTAMYLLSYIAMQVREVLPENSKLYILMIKDFLKIYSSGRMAKQAQEFDVDFDKYIKMLGPVFQTILSCYTKSSNDDTFLDVYSAFQGSEVHVFLITVLIKSFPGAHVSKHARELAEGVQHLAF